MKSKRGMTQEELVKMIVALVILAILLYLAYKYVLKGGENTAKLGECMSKPGQDCLTDAEVKSCTGQAFKFGCPDTKPYCCVKSAS